MSHQPQAALLALAIAGLACSVQAADKAPAESAAADSKVIVPHYKPTGKPPSAARGEAIFMDHCALCHGVTGKGDGPRSAFFVPGGQYIPDMTVAQVLAGRDKQLVESIREGLHRMPEPMYIMPQFKYILSDEEIRSVLLYVKTLSKKSATR